MTMTKGRTALVAVAAVFILIQLVPVEQSNRSFDRTKSFEAAEKPTPELEALLRRSCYDCHSDQTAWPWYSRIAPGSWLITKDVRDGRKKLNLSEWGNMETDEAENRMGELCDEVRGGTMPPKAYLLLHPGARLTQKDVSAICTFSPSETN